MKRNLLQAVALPTSWAVGLLTAMWIVPGVAITPWGFVAAVGVFALTQTILFTSIVKLPHSYASLLFGGTGLVLTIVALICASFARTLTFSTSASWVATAVVVWLATTIGAITVPELIIRDDPGRGHGRHA